MQANTLDDIFFLPLSQQALNELEHIQGIIQNVTYDENGRDTWLPSWGPVREILGFHPGDLFSLPTSSTHSFTTCWKHTLSIE